MDRHLLHQKVPKSECQKLESFTTSKTDRHLLRQKVGQKISVIKTNTFDDIEKIVQFGILIHALS